jgi:hypothetical protein
MPRPTASWRAARARGPGQGRAPERCRGAGGPARPPVRRWAAARADRWRPGSGSASSAAGLAASISTAIRDLPELFEVAALCDVDAAKAPRGSGGVLHRAALSHRRRSCAWTDLDVVDLCTPPVPPRDADAPGPGGGEARHLREAALRLPRGRRPGGRAAEKRSGPRVMPIFQYRFGHGIQKLRRLVDQGVTGRAFLTTVETAWRRRPAYYAVPWRSRLGHGAGRVRGQSRDPRARPGRATCWDPSGACLASSRPS